MEVCRAQSCPSIEHTTKVGAILLLVGRPRLKGDASHGAMNRDGNRRQGECARKDDDVLMKGNRVTSTWSLRRSDVGDRGSNTSSVGGHYRIRMMLLKKHRSTLLGDVIPGQRVDVLALRTLGSLTPSPLLKVLDLNSSVRANAWFIGVGTDVHVLTLLLFGPRVWQPASPTLAFNEATTLAALGGIITTGVAL